MFCMKCGTELPSDANFCLTCGEPTSSTGAARGETRGVETETCEINHVMDKYRFLGNNDCHYEAVAIGPEGKYVAAKSPPFKELDEKSDDKAFNAIISQLSADGWEQIGKGRWRYSIRFRRKVRR